MAITFIATSFQEVTEGYMFISHLLLQNNPQWKCIIYNNGLNPHLEAVVWHFSDPRITYLSSETNSGSWGCYNRLASLDRITSQFTINTSIQDYYSPNLVQEIVNNQDKDFIYWNSTHHSFDYNTLDTIPKIGSIDWGNFAVKTSILKQVGIINPTSVTSDGETVEALFQSGLIKSDIKINKILTIKN